MAPTTIRTVGRYHGLTVQVFWSRDLQRFNELCRALVQARSAGVPTVDPTGVVTRALGGDPRRGSCGAGLAFGPRPIAHQALRVG